MRNYLFKIRLNLFSIITAIVFTNLLFISHADASMKKWVDERGQVHYGDRIPSKYLRGEHSELNNQGVVVNTSEKMKTSDELSKDAKKRKAIAEENKKKLIAARRAALRDRVLLDTFTTEKDLSIARDARLDSIDSQLSLAETLIKNDERKLADVKTRIDEIEKSGRDAPENLYKEVTSVSKQLENNYSFVEDKTNERAYIIESFKDDVKRFRELMKEKHEARLLQKK